MTTQNQIEANRRNSRGSTGPKTRTGKAESKMNAMKHGLLAAGLVVRDEDPVEFAGVLESLIDEFQPQGPLEEQLVERLRPGPLAPPLGATRKTSVQSANYRAMKQRSSDRFIGLSTNYSASKRPDKMANHLPQLPSMSPWTAPAHRLIVTIRQSQDS